MVIIISQLFVFAAAYVDCINVKHTINTLIMFVHVKIIYTKDCNQFLHMGKNDSYCISINPWVVALVYGKYTSWYLNTLLEKKLELEILCGGFSLRSDAQQVFLCHIGKH